MSAEPKRTPALSFRSVTRRYGDVIAVDDLNLDIEPGEFVTLLGPSGSGKSTTLLMVAGFLDPTSGHILAAGTSLRGVPPERRNIGMVFQHYALFPHMSVSANVAFPLRMRNWPRDRISRAVIEMLRVLQLEGLGPRRPHQLSGGQQQRVALGRALIFHPHVVLMDEPLGALDRALREELQLEIKHTLARAGSTTVYVTHDQTEAISMSDRIAIMRGGRVEQVGTPVQVYRQPRSRFVAEFLGRATLLNGVVLGRERTGIDVEIPNAGGLRLKAQSRSPEAVGQAVRVVVRPEDVQVEPGPSDPSGGLVTEETFYGSVIKRRIQLGEAELLVDDPQTRDSLGVGARVSVSVKRAWILDNEA